MPPTSGRIVVAGHEVTGTIAERTAALCDRLVVLLGGLVLAR